MQPKIGVGRTAAEGSKNCGRLENGPGPGQGIDDTAQHVGPAGGVNLASQPIWFHTEDDRCYRGCVNDHCQLPLDVIGCSG